MASEQFSLCWDDFHKNMSSGMTSLLENEDLVDVTLAVQGKYLKAHKMVLSVCSPYFKELFKVNPCKHPIVFMKDVSYTAMSDLLQFMYQGEVQVSQENLTTFIKTAEALQVKGLTGDGNGTTEESDIQEECPEQETKIHAQSSKSKKSIAPQPPAPKRQRVMAESTPVISPIVSEPVKKQEQNSVSELVQFKMEPYDQSQNLTNDDEQEDTFGEDTLDETNDDNEDYSMMEGGDEEPQAGTSADGTTGEGQDVKIKIEGAETVDKKKTVRMRFVANGFVYHNNVIAGSPPFRYLGCAEHRKSGCRGRATIPVGGTLDQLKMTQPHNHPPDVNAFEKDAFVKELRKAVRSIQMKKATLKKIYETVAVIYPTAAKEISFKNVCSSMHRWRTKTL